MKAAPPRIAVLRRMLAGMSDRDATGVLAAHLREVPAQDRARTWTAAQFLMADRPEVLRAAATGLMQEPAHRSHAALALARLFNRQQAWPDLHALILAEAENPPMDPPDWVSGLLRINLLAPGLVSPAEQARALALQPPLAQVAQAVQQAVATGTKPPIAQLHARLGRVMEKARADGLPGDLLRLSGARDVAVVGNGSGMVGARAAAAIEAKDCVIRLNYPVLSGHEPDTGRRTDLMLFAEPKRSTLPSLVAREPGYGDLPAFGVSCERRVRPGAEGPPPIPKTLARVVAMLAYPQPTTGFFAILLAAVLFRRPITMFGFDFFAPGRPGHYFGATNAAPQHELAYERWYTDQVLPLLGAPGGGRA